MIRTDAEYQAAKKEAAARRKRIADYRDKLVSEGIPEEQLRRALEPVTAFAFEIEHELKRYEQLRAGDTREIARLRELGQILIALRVSKRVTQRELASRLGVDESTVSRDERNEYQGVRMERVGGVLAALGARCTLRLTNEGTAWLAQSYAYVPDSPAGEANAELASYVQASPAGQHDNDNLALAA